MFKTFLCSCDELALLMWCRENHELQGNETNKEAKLQSPGSTGVVLWFPTDLFCVCMYSMWNMASCHSITPKRPSIRCAILIRTHKGWHNVTVTLSICSKHTRLKEERRNIMFHALGITTHTRMHGGDIMGASVKRN